MKLVKESHNEMTDERLLQYVRECVEFLAKHGYDATMDDIKCVVSSATTTFGTMTCKTRTCDKYTLTLSKYLKDEPEEAIKNTIYHELCHYLQYKYNFKNNIWDIDNVNCKLIWGKNATKENKTNSKGHGRVWKKFASEIGKLTNQDISRTNTYELHKDVGQAYDNKIKYVVTCMNCGCTIEYTKKTEFVRDPNISSYDYKMNCKDSWYYKNHFRDHPEEIEKAKSKYHWQCGRCHKGGQWIVEER